MNELLAARSLTTLPVVTLGGDAVAQLKDTVFDAAAGRITGFTLSGRGLLSGPPDAVLVRTTAEPAEVPPHHELPGLRILTETGDTLGAVQDVAFEPGTGRVEAVVTAHGDLPADHLLGLGDYALVVRAA
ncbi:PRC-barrel domain-containing protein [Streptomyces sp. AK010]|uniref:PRC-barrel domain-containing protein n=1 Tax=Streptomyces sp. AK010 TaxID=2723074 RepID=UPI00161A7DF3|nr:PRC-barrel domain-containing protein [Streptomyces sp. AK010]MBB6420290.1 sporulation protein YlmC with PRC-barrel domain [Streptomyces sp. AK010]